MAKHPLEIQGAFHTSSDSSVNSSEIAPWFTSTPVSVRSHLHETGLDEITSAAVIIE